LPIANSRRARGSHFVVATGWTQSNRAGVSRVWISLAEWEWIGCDSTPQAMSYAMETVADIEERERRVS